MEEVWRPVLGFEPHYEVSSLGRVRRKETGKILKQSTTYGYRHVTMHAGGKHAQPRVHVVVCAAFHGPRPSPRHQAAHGDGDRGNNTPLNLRWATPEENAADKRLHGKHLCGELVHGAKLHPSAIEPIRRLLAAHVSAPVIASAFGVSATAIRSVGHGETWAHLTPEAA